MSERVRIAQPLVVGSRRIYPVVAEAVTGYGCGMAGTVLPLALIIEEDGRYTCALLGTDTLVSLLEKLGAAYL